MSGLYLNLILDKALLMSTTLHLSQGHHSTGCFCVKQTKEMEWAAFECLMTFSVDKSIQIALPCQQFKRSAQAWGQQLLPSLNSVELWMPQPQCSEHTC